MRPAALIVVILALVLSPAPIALGAGTSHASNWSIQSNNVVCGIAKVPGTRPDPGTGAPLNGLWPGLQCATPGIPRPAHGGAVGDPFVQLGQGRAGRARVVDESQDDLISNSPQVTLKAGSSWRGDGIVCAVHASAIRCHNSVGHGFSLAPGHVHIF
jgi:hypothetical protein